MVKAFGYGNRGYEIAKLLSHHKVDYLGVAFADEGISLKNAGIDLPIMVLNPENTSFSAIIQHQLEPEIYSIKGLTAFLKIAETALLLSQPASAAARGAHIRISGKTAKRATATSISRINGTTP